NTIIKLVLVCSPNLLLPAFMRSIIRILRTFSNSVAQHSHGLVQHDWSNWFFAASYLLCGWWKIILFICLHAEDYAVLMSLLYSAIALIAGGLTLLLPETAGHDLAETLADAEKFSE
ncbi:solute carrier family 22 member 2, partial [Trichinella spiralis]|uniref:solute carrier family 22 member 2 n=1 Tax=Trichinella spiralis TaxID=6334 RepID=UPI0001EFE5EC